MTPAGILMGCLCVLTSVFRFGISFRTHQGQAPLGGWLASDSESMSSILDLQGGWSIHDYARSPCYFCIMRYCLIYVDAHLGSVALKQALADRKIIIGAPDGFNQVTVGTNVQNKLFIQALKDILGHLKTKTDDRLA